jgi:hypothetical protein
MQGYSDMQGRFSIGRVTASLAAVAALVGTLISSPAAAQSLNPANLIHGFWNVEWREAGEDKLYDRARIQVQYRGPGQYRVRGCHTTYRSPARPDGIRKPYCGWRYGSRNTISAESGELTIVDTMHPYGTGISKVRFTDRNTAEGSWQYDGASRYRAARGTVTWRRSIPRIDRVVLTSEIRSVFRPGETGAAKFSYDHRFTSGHGHRESRPFIAVEIYGTDLWGPRYVGIHTRTAAEKMLELYDRREIREPVPGGGERTRQIGIQFRVAAWRDASYGEKIINVDNIWLPFNLTIDGHPDLPRLGIVVATKESDAVAARTTGLVPEEDVFWFRAEYVRDPGADAPKTKTMVVRWQGGTREITLRRSAQFPRFYLAGPYYGSFSGDGTTGNADQDPSAGTERR